MGKVVGGELGLELVGRSLSRDVARGVVAVWRIPMPTRSGGARHEAHDLSLYNFLPG